MIWSAGKLKNNYSRSIVGYDLRINIVEDQPKTISRSIWPQHPSRVGYEFEKYENGINLSFDLESLLLVEDCDDSFLVAFDIPTDLAELVRTTFGLHLLDTNSMPMPERWEFLGYDIVDIWTQSSALYDFSINKIEYFLAHDSSIEVNNHGLVSSADSAIKLVGIFDEKIKEHSPFSPCGIWAFR